MAGGRVGEGGLRGRLFETCVDRIIHLQAKAFVLENVAGILSIHAGAFWERMLDKLVSRGGCRVWHCVLNSADHGIRHHRRRVYMVGVLNAESENDVEWPCNTGHLPLEQFIESGGEARDKVFIVHAKRCKLVRCNEISI